MRTKYNTYADITANPEKNIDNTAIKYLMLSPYTEIKRGKSNMTCTDKNNTHIYTQS